LICCICIVIFILALESCVPVKKRCDVQIWRASPDDVGHALWRVLTKLLSLQERSKAFEFRIQADRKAYVLAHGLRRLALAAMLDEEPNALVFRDNEKGQPQLIEPHHRRIYFSHSHTRQGVLFAASLDAAVGVDAESVVAEPVDFTLLGPFLVLPDVRAAEAATFYDYWTALEAFWKADGTGLSTDHPRLRLSAHPLGHWDVAFDALHDSDLFTHAVIFPVTSAPGCVASLAIICPSKCDTFTFVIHEKELNKDAELMRLFFMAGSVSRSASHAATPSAKLFV
jgi:4'-phosphopantetheinyl transferase